MRITFILPRYCREPVGGYLVVYEYANRLSRKGHSVCLIHRSSASLTEGMSLFFKRYLRQMEDAIKKKQPPWFDIDSTVEFKIVPKLNDHYIPDADVVIATWWETANIVAMLPRSKGEKCYFVQGYEVFGGPEDKVHATYALPLKIITIAPYLEATIRGVCPTADVDLVSNGIDVDRFKIFTLPQDRENVVGMLWSTSAVKGVSYGLEALEIARKEVPDMKALVFGGGRVRPTELPEWIEFFGTVPNHDMPRLYNKCSIFLHSSVSEGWSLPAAESMACGCCLVAAANDGVKSYAVHDRNSILVPIKDGVALGKALAFAIKNKEYRLKLANQGVEDMKRYTWEASVEMFEGVLRRAVDQSRQSG